jgi:hypothetical protein
MNPKLLTCTTYEILVEKKKDYFTLLVRNLDILDTNFSPSSNKGL